jgi:8-oxo-dGTP pyrophosphatase MutT (NUDIX family)
MTVSRNQSAPAPTKKYVGAGVILMRGGGGGEEDSEPRVLLLLGRETGVWSFSKGHPEEEDRGSPLRTAVRETREETGYEVGCDYRIIGDALRFGKRPYWVGVVGQEAPPVRLADREHTAAGWFTANEAAALNTNTDVRAWIKKAQGGCPTAGWTRLIASLAHASTAPRRLSAPVGIVS